MFSSKTTALQASARRAVLAGRTILYLIPDCDTRYDAHATAPLNRSHDGASFPARRIEGSLEHVDAPNEVTDIFIDEAHFVHGIESYALRQRAAGKNVYLACLRTDYQGRPWPNTATLVACHAYPLVCMQGVCIVCNADANYTRLRRPRSAAGDDTFLLGGDETYACVCAAHVSDPPELDSHCMAQRAARVKQLTL